MKKDLFILNHLEYDTNTLNTEFIRDSLVNHEADQPINYFPHDDSRRKPINRWRSHGHLLYGNWINEIYQHTPFEVSKIGSKDVTKS